MSARVSSAVEVGCVLLIAAGVAAVYWPAALIVGGALLLLGMQGVGRRREDGQ